MHLFFVCGAPKSGTTWVQRILDAHPEVSCSGEGHFIERFAAPMTQTVNAYNQALAVETTQVYEGRPYYGPISQREFDELARTFIVQRLMSRRPGPQVRWIGDKTPAYARQLGDLHRIAPDARFIHVVRDPREVASSALAHAHRGGLADALTAGSTNNRDQIRLMIALWLQSVSAVDAFAAAHPELVHEVTYADLHADTLGELARLFRFLGVADDAGVVSEVERATSFETMSGRKPGAEDLTSFFRKGLPGAWMDHLDPDGARLVVDACGDLMRRKGFLTPQQGERAA